MKIKKRFILLIIIIIACSLFGLKTNTMIKVGEKLPAFVLFDKDGKELNSSDLPKPLVMFFYPKNETSVCTKEACYFRDYFEQFANNGIEVIGISKDNAISHKNFASKYNLPYPLYTDVGGKALKTLGASKFLGLVSARVTLVINKDGEIIHIFDSPIKAEAHVKTALSSLGIGQD